MKKPAGGREGGTLPGETRGRCGYINIYNPTHKMWARFGYKFSGLRQNPVGSVLVEVFVGIRKIVDSG